MGEFTQRPKGTGNNRVPVKRFNHVGGKPKVIGPKMGTNSKPFSTLAEWRKGGHI